MSKYFRLAILFSLLVSMVACESSQTTAEPPAATADPAPAKLTGAAAAPAMQANAGTKCKLTMGWDPWEPYQFMDVDGNVRGLDIELVTAIAEGADCELIFVEGRWVTLLGQLQRGEVDLLTGATRTEARDSFAHFTDTYRVEDFALFLRSEELAEYADRTLEELLADGFRIGITEQYVYGDKITTLREDPRYADQFVGATIGELNVARLLDMAIDGFIEDPFVAARLVRNKGLADDIASHPEEIHSGNVNLMFSKTSVEPEIAQRFNVALEALRASGGHQHILDKYLRTGSAR